MTISPSIRAISELQHQMLDNETEGWEIIEQMNRLIERDGFASVGDLAGLMGRSDLLHYTQDQIGWVAPLLHACVRRKVYSTYYFLDLPTPVERKTVESVLDAQPMSTYFGPENSQWMTNPEFNMLLCRQTENWANDKLRVQGHLFVNEVLDMLGIKRTTDGQKKGWLAQNGIRKIDFGLPTNLTSVFDGDGRILLTFNVDGEIIDRI